jgi:acyl-CoA synthetase (NDP forming)
VDVGLTASLDVEIYIRATEELARDPQVDAVVVIGIGLSPQSNERLVDGLVEVRREGRAAVALVGIPGFPPELAQRLCLSGIPFFETAERAMRTLAHIHKDALRFRHRIEGG